MHQQKQLTMHLGNYYRSCTQKLHNHAHTTSTADCMYMTVTADHAPTKAATERAHKTKVHTHTKTAADYTQNFTRPCIRTTADCAHKIIVHAHTRSLAESIHPNYSWSCHAPGLQQLLIPKRPQVMLD